MWGVSIGRGGKRVVERVGRGAMLEEGEGKGGALNKGVES